MGAMVEWDPVVRKVFLIDLFRSANQSEVSGGVGGAESVRPVYSRKYNGYFETRLPIILEKWREYFSVHCLSQKFVCKQKSIFLTNIFSLPV